jgi:ketosteroid isomerase-like protein
VSITEFTARGTHKEDLPGIPATGRRVEVVACDVIEARDGKIYRRREYYDELSFREQLGAIEPDPVDAGPVGPLADQDGS